MKKLILTLVLLFSIFAINISAQSYANQYQQQQVQKFVPRPETVVRTNITLNQIQNGWALWGSACAGCPAYWYQVTVTQQPVQAEDGNFYYYYYFYFFSNSHYTNGAQAGTYLSQVSFYSNNNFIFQTPYILLPAGQQVWGSWMRLPYNNAMVSFTVTNVSVQ